MMISVCMATYNGARYVGDRLESILKALPEDAEVIIVDDGSTDGTRHILSGYAKRYANVRYLNNEHNMGPLKSFERAVSLSRGEVVMLSDQDDLWHHEKVQRTLESLRASGAGVVVSDAVLVDGSGAPIGESFFQLRGSGPGALKNFYKNTYLGCCMAFRSELKDVVLPFPSGVAQHDEWIGLVGELVAGVKFLPDKLVSYRRHGANTSSFQRFPLPRVLRNRAVMAAALLARSPKILAARKKWRAA